MNDFIVVILEALIAAALRLSRGHAREVVSFLEGPYVLELTTPSERMISVRALFREDVERGHALIHGDVLLDNLLCAADETLAVCWTLGDRSKDIERLRVAITDGRSWLRKFQSGR